MVIAKIGNPMIPDTSDASRAQYEQLKKLSAEYGVDVTLFPAKGTQAYNDWYTNFPRAARSGIKIETKDGSKTYQYPKEPTINWLLQKMASAGWRSIVIRLWLIGWTYSTKEHRRQPACVL